jgi:preprotein translocase subunit SecF
MEFFTHANFDFMGRRRLFATISVIAIVVSAFAVFVHGKLNVGIEFAGGSQLTLRFRDAIDLEGLRKTLAARGVGDAQLQRFGEAENHEVMIRVPAAADAAQTGGARVVEALAAEYGTGTGFDLNRRGADALSALLFEADPLSLRSLDEIAARQQYDDVAAAVLERRKEVGILSSYEQLGGIAAVGPEVLEVLQAKTTLGAFSILGEESVGPQVGSELRQKGIYAVLFSLLGMLAYIWFRFELRFGVGALVALLHDVLITLGLFAALDYEFNLTTVAAFLTLVGYSVNDTVVVFDRVRENMRARPREDFEQTLNIALNQTLSRTILTGLTTLLAVGALYFLGGDVLKGFGFVLLIGIFVGTYSSIFVASPIALVWDRIAHRRTVSAKPARA